MTDPRPTIEAPDDDPYLWLEEIDGERALAWVEAQNSATLDAIWRCAFRGRSRHACSYLRSARQHPDNCQARRRSLQFLERCGAPARPLAGDIARQLPPRTAGLGHSARPRRARGNRRRGLDVERGCDDPGRSRPSHSDAVARRRRCSGAARIRPGRAEFRSRGFCAARSQGRGRLARSRHAAAVLCAGRRTWPPTRAMRAR